MDFYEFEYIVKNLIDILKEKEEAEKGQQEKAEEKYGSPSSMMRDAQKQMPKMPSMPSVGNMNFPSIPSSFKI